jgi:hypothetical protein
VLFRGLPHVVWRGSSPPAFHNVISTRFLRRNPSGRQPFRLRPLAVHVVIPRSSPAAGSGLLHSHVAAVLQPALSFEGRGISSLILVPFASSTVKHQYFFQLANLQARVSLTAFPQPFQLVNRNCYRPVDTQPSFVVFLRVFIRQPFGGIRSAPRAAPSAIPGAEARLQKFIPLPVIFFARLHNAEAHLCFFQSPAHSLHKTPGCHQEHYQIPSCANKSCRIRTYREPPCFAGFWQKPQSRKSFRIRTYARVLL